MNKKRECFNCVHYGIECPVDKVGTGIPCSKWEGEENNEFLCD